MQLNLKGFHPEFDEKNNEIVYYRVSWKDQNILVDIKRLVCMYHVDEFGQCRNDNEEEIIKRLLNTVMYL